MLRWAVIFLILAMVAGLFGFGGISVVSVNIAQTLFAVFLILFVISIVAGLLTGKKPTTLID